MLIIGIWNTKRKLYKFQREPEMKGRYEKIEALAKKIGAYLHNRHIDDQDQYIKEIVPQIHIVLQTEMMLQACIFAAIAAFMSFISVMLFLFLR